jgi:hypothetical protein
MGECPSGDLPFQVWIGSDGEGFSYFELIDGFTHFVSTANVAKL